MFDEAWVLSSKPNSFRGRLQTALVLGKARDICHQTLVG
jgi:hypothetical protein